MMPHRTVRASLARAVRRAVCAAALAAAAWSSPVLAQEAASAVQDVTLADVALPLGGTAFRAPKVTVSGTRLSKGDLTAILKADSPEPWAGRLARLEAASIAVPVLVSEHAGPGGAVQTVTYREVVARDVRAGRIAELTMAGATVGISDGPHKGSGTYGRIAATDLDLAALVRLSAEPGDGRGPVQRVYASVQLADVTYADEAGFAMKLARLEGRDLGFRPVPGGWNGALAALADGLDAVDPEMPAAARARLAATVADLLDGMAVGALDLHGLSLSDADPEGPMLFEIARVGYAGSGTGAGTTLEGVSFAQGGLKARLGRLTLSGLSLAPTIATLRRLADPAVPVADEDLRRLTPALGGASLQEAGLDLPTEDPAPARPGPAKPGAPPVPPPAAVAPSAPLRLGLRNAALALGAMRDGVPTTSRLDLAGLTLPATMVAGVPVLGALPAYGYGDLDLNLVIDSAWDEAKREVAFREMTLSGRDMGSLRLAGVVGGLGPELFTGTVPASTLLMASATARTLDLTVQNAGLFERFLEAQAKSLSLKPEELRQEYVAASQFGVPAILGNSPAARAIGAAMSQFVVKPGRLVLSARAKSAAGLGFLDFGTARSPAAILDKLDVEARAE